MRPPTRARFLTDPEWNILTGVFGGSLPLRMRILLTDGLGGGDAPFTIPTSAISAASVPAIMQAALSGLVTTHLGRVGSALATAANYTGFVGPGAMLSQALGMVNAGYIVSVGPTAYPDMTTDAHRDLLVHELSHVWQGANSTSSMTYVVNSVMHQCRGSFGAAGTRNGAYAVEPGDRWASYNAEQQASLIERWYHDGKPQSGDIWPYIRDRVRLGRA